MKKYLFRDTDDQCHVDSAVIDNKPNYGNKIVKKVDYNNGKDINNPIY